MALIHQARWTAEPTRVLGSCSTEAGAACSREDLPAGWHRALHPPWSTLRGGWAQPAPQSCPHMELQGTARGCGLPACPTPHHEIPNTSCPLPIPSPTRAVAPRGQVGQQSCAAPSAGGIPLHGSCPSASCPSAPTPRQLGSSRWLHTSGNAGHDGGNPGGRSPAQALDGSLGLVVQALLQLHLL